LSSSKSFRPFRRNTHTLHIAAVSGVVLMDLDRRCDSKTSIRVRVTIANWRYSGAAADGPARRDPRGRRGDAFVVRTLSSPVRATAEF
jgi:hypothetical protein